ncbi:MAG: non-ribosomal peptide synthetase, partial [Gammaproteobacteria bacterium]
MTATLSEKIADLSPAKRALLEAMLSKEKEPGKSSCIGRSDRSAPVPLSYAQQRLWFLDRLIASGDVFNMTWAVRLEGPLNVDALVRGLNEIVRRHEALRTSFALKDGEPVQVIHGMPASAVEIIDLSSYPAAQREDEALRIIRRADADPFDLDGEPLSRTKLLRLSDDAHVVLNVTHHAVSDGWSRSIFSRELEALYGAFAVNRPSPLQEPAIQYADYAVWQRTWLQGANLSRQLDYWKSKLAGLPLLDLPTDFPRPDQQSYRGARESMQLPAAMIGSLKILAKAEGATLFMTLLSAFQLLLHRLSGQDDFAVGSPIAGRNRQEFEELIGFFVNTLVLRTGFGGNPSFRGLLGRVRDVCLEAYAHQDIPFEKLVAELQPQRDLSRHPFIDVMVNLFDRSEHLLKLPGIKSAPLPTGQIKAKFFMTLYISLDGEDVYLDLVYQTDLFSAGRMAILLDQFRFLLGQIAENPDLPITHYSLVGPASKSLLPDPAAVIPEPRQPFVHELFLQLADRHPDNIAVSQGKRTWTYRELALRSRQLAGRLKLAGLDKGDVIAVSGPKCFDLIAALLAVLIRGGVMLTLDPGLPNLRKRQLLEQTRARTLCLVGPRDPDEVRLASDIGVIDFGEEEALSRGLPTKRELPISLDGNDPAYVFFTSGSTGQPKGILGCHKGLGHFIDWQRNTFGIGAGDRVSQLTSLSFDVVLRDIFLPLSAGACVCLPLEEDMTDVFGWLAKTQVSIVHSVPTLLETWLMDAPENPDLSKLRFLFISGEPLTGSLVASLRRLARRDLDIVNLYGATETTMVKCYHRVPEIYAGGIQPIGRPITHAQALVAADAGSRPCSVGEPGEIILRTPFRSLGYINDPDETARRFIRNPFRQDGQDLFYLTGDRGRYRPDGLLEISGRLDDQVKILGVRVEPAEVAAALGQHEKIRASSVLPFKKGNRLCLAAYVVIVPESQLSAAELKTYLGQRLPPVMIPETIVFMRRLPRLPNGKVDRKILPPPDPTDDSHKPPYAEPVSALEKQLAGIWAELLKLERVGIHDNFFDLGGHSLLAVSLLNRIEKKLALDLPVMTIFHCPTVAQLAEK